MADGDVLQIIAGHQAFAPGGGGVTVDNGTDPPTEVTSIVAAGATIVGDEATLPLAVFLRTTNLTDAQIKALPTTPIPLVPAQGAGKIVFPLAVFIQVDATSDDYTNLSTPVFELGWPSERWVAVTTSATQDLLTSFGTSGSDATIQRGVQIFPDNMADLAFTLTLDNSLAGNLTGGHASNSGKVSVIYTVLDR